MSDTFDSTLASLTDPNRYEPEIDLPKYSDRGRILVRVLGPCFSQVYNHEYEVLDYDGSAFWISEGAGFDYWLDEMVVFPGPGLYLIEGIVGAYIRGDWAWGEDDDEEWEWELMTRVDPEREALDD